MGDKITFPTAINCTINDNFWIGGKGEAVGIIHSNIYYLAKILGLPIINEGGSRAILIEHESTGVISFSESPMYPEKPNSGVTGDEPEIRATAPSQLKIIVGCGSSVSSVEDVVSSRLQNKLNFGFYDY